RSSRLACFDRRCTILATSKGRASGLRSTLQRTMPYACPKWRPPWSAIGSMLLCHSAPTPRSRQSMRPVRFRSCCEVPIVLLANGDPVGVGLVNSLAHPGGNITGTSSMGAELGAKHVKLLQDMLPNLRRVAALSNSADAFFGQVFVNQIAVAGKARQIE